MGGGWRLFFSNESAFEQQRITLRRAIPADDSPPASQSRGLWLVSARFCPRFCGFSDCFGRFESLFL
jgi:hypothetical protein